MRKPADEKAIEMICDTPIGNINKLIALLGIGLMGLMANLVHAGNWWESDWETHSPRWSEDNGSGSWGEFWTHSNNPRTPWHVGVVGGDHPRRAGAQSIRFERRTGFCGGDDCGWNSERTELGSDVSDRPGDDRWYAWSVYHQNYQWLRNVAPIHGQFKTSNSGHQYAFFNMDQHRGMVINFDAFEGWSGSKVLIPKSEISNKWHDIRGHAKWSTGADGIFQIWVDGILKLDRRGPNAIDNDSIWFRFGIYAPQASRAGAGRPTQVVYYDELVRGNSCQSVSQFMACNATTNFSTYVDKYGDLLAAYNATGSGQSKAT